MLEIIVCTNHRPVSGQPSCGARGSEALLALLCAGIEARQLNCRARASVCLGHCEKGPNVRVLGQPFQHGMNEAGIEHLLDELAEHQQN